MPRKRAQATRLTLRWDVQKSVATAKPQADVTIDIVKGKRGWFWLITQGETFKVRGAEQTRIECQIQAEQAWKDLA